MPISPGIQPCRVVRVSFVGNDHLAKLAGGIARTVIKLSIEYDTDSDALLDHGQQQASAVSHFEEIAVIVFRDSRKSDVVIDLNRQLE